MKKKIYILSNFTFQPFKTFINKDSKKFNLDLKINIGKFNQIDQELYDIKKNKTLLNSDLILLAIDFNYFYPENSFNYSRKNNNEIIEIINKWLKIIRENTSAKIIVWNFVGDINSYKFFINCFDESDNLRIVEKLNIKLRNLIKNFKDVLVFQINKIVQNYGIKNVYDDRFTYLAKVPFNSEYYEKISFNLVRLISASFSTPKKCLVLDLDNTLWGGVLGEDGMSGIKLGNNYEGSKFVEFQKYILSLKKRGVLLSILSKNNSDDVKKVFKEHDRMILKLSDFVNTKINWEDKHKNILLMSKEIGIGLNSMVFFDDSKIEREAMKNFLPEVLTIEVGKNVSNYIDNIEHTGSFDNSNLTKEDLDRTKKYEIQNQAKILEKKFVNKNEFLKSLKMISIIKPVSVVSFDRAVQLTNKTNQFNLTLNRYDPAKFKKLIDKKKSSIALTMQLKDKFGDHGITGLVVLIKKNKKTWEIDTFLLSCRVIGRGVEDAFLNQVIKILKKKDKNCEMLVGYYKKGPKNVLVKDFYKNQNFTKYKNTYLFNILKDRNKTSKFIKTVK